MGEVYLAYDMALCQQIALKTILSKIAGTPHILERFHREILMGRAVTHPNVCRVFDMGTELNERTGKTVHFLTMEYLPGETLSARLRRTGKLSPQQARPVIRQILLGLDAAHRAGIVHRDLKPDNMMITTDGHAKILDFGLAKLIEQAQLPESDSSEIATAMMPQHSTPGTVMGTIGYMSPEQAQGKTKEIDQRSDIFSFGCILFEAATGKKPFEGESIIKSLHMVVYEAPPLIAELNPLAPPELQRIIRRCLAKDRDDRYQSIKDVAIELRDLRRELEGAGSRADHLEPHWVVLAGWIHVEVRCCQVLRGALSGATGCWVPTGAGC
jgi:serine/threonine protein kinase